MVGPILARVLLSQEFAPQRMFRRSVPPGSLVLVLLAWGSVAAFKDERAMAGQARVTVVEAAGIETTAVPEKVVEWPL